MQFRAKLICKANFQLSVYTGEALRDSFQLILLKPSLRYSMCRQLIFYEVFCLKNHPLNSILRNFSYGTLISLNVFSGEIAGILNYRLLTP